MDAKAARRSLADAYGQAVWSWRPDAGVKFVDGFHGRRWLKSPAHRGERGAAVKTIAQGMPVFRRYLSLLACAKCTFLCTQGSRVRPASGIPCALSLRGRTLLASPGRFVSRGRGVAAAALRGVDPSRRGLTAAPQDE